MQTPDDTEALLQTARLTLRRFTPADRETLIEIHGNREVARRLGGAPWSPTKTERWLERTLRFYEQLDAGHLAIVRRADRRLIGRCGLTPFYVQTETHEARAGTGGEICCYHGSSGPPPGAQTTFAFELGYTLAREAWGNGYATEAATAVRDLAFAVREEQRIISLIEEDNHPSIAVAHRLGLRLRGAARFISLGGYDLHPIDLSVLLFALDRREWAALGHARNSS